MIATSTTRSSRRARLRLRQRLHLRPALDLEDADGVGRLEHLEDLGDLLGHASRGRRTSAQSCSISWRVSSIAASIPSPSRSSLISFSSSTSRLSNWTTTRSCIVARSIGAMSMSGAAVTSIPPEWMRQVAREAVDPGAELEPALPVGQPDRARRRAPAAAAPARFAPPSCVRIRPPDPVHADAAADVAVGRAAPRAPPCAVDGLPATCPSGSAGRADPSSDPSPAAALDARRSRDRSRRPSDERRRHEPARARRRSPCPGPLAARRRSPACRRGRPRRPRARRAGSPAATPAPPPTSPTGSARPAVDLASLGAGLDGRCADRSQLAVVERRSARRRRSRGGDSCPSHARAGMPSGVRARLGTFGRRGSSPANDPAGGRSETIVGWARSAAGRRRAVAAAGGGARVRAERHLRRARRTAAARSGSTGFGGWRHGGTLPTSGIRVLSWPIPSTRPSASAASAAPASAGSPSPGRRKNSAKPPSASRSRRTMTLSYVSSAFATRSTSGRGKPSA